MQQTQRQTGRVRRSWGSPTRRTLLALALVFAVVGAFALATAQAAQAQSMTNAQQRDAVVKEAHRLLRLGTPYVPSYSGPNPCSPQGADCECFNRLTYKKANISLPYTLAGQINKGKKTSTPRRGDLIFFDETGNGKYGDSHDGTGVYVGNGYFIMSSNYFGKIHKMKVSDGRKYIGPYIYVKVIPYH